MGNTSADSRIHLCKAHCFHLAGKESESRSEWKHQERFPNCCHFQNLFKVTAMTENMHTFSSVSAHVVAMHVKSHVLHFALRNLAKRNAYLADMMNYLSTEKNNTMVVLCKNKSKQQQQTTNKQTTPTPKKKKGKSALFRIGIR